MNPGLPFKEIREDDFPWGHFNSHSLFLSHRSQEKNTECFKALDAGKQSYEAMTFGPYSGLPSNPPIKVNNF